MSPLPFRKELPPHTRLILASEDLLATWGARSEDGYRISAEWGEEKPEGWYEPTFTKHFDDDLRAAERKATVARIRAALEACLVFNGKEEVQEIRKIGIRDALSILDAEAAK